MSGKITIFIFLLFLFYNCKNKPLVLSTDLLRAQIYALENHHSKNPPIDRIIGNIDDFKKQYFSPWHLHPDSINARMEKLPGKDLSFLDKYIGDLEYYAENKKPHSPKLKEHIFQNSNKNNFPNTLEKGITIKHANIRRLPTEKPGFDLYTKAGEGFPFDYFQETAIWSNTPVLIVHYSTDKSWAYILCSFYKGWMQTDNIALVEEETIELWKKSDLFSLVQDNAPLITEEGISVGAGKIGMVLPLVSKTDNKINLLVALTNHQKNAVLKNVELNAAYAELIPFIFNENNIKKLALQLEGNPYGWGGYLGNRDCSSTIRDLFIPFGKLLPRNSSDQSTCGKLDAELPAKNDDKLKIIATEGIPYLTVFYKRGHAMLYAGINEQNEPLIFHTIWGLKTSYYEKELNDILKKYPMEGMHKDKEEEMFHGRLIIGKSILSSIYLGQDIAHVNNSILDDLTHMTVIE